MLGSIPLVPVTTADADVPAALDANGVQRTITGCGTGPGTTMTFPSTAGVFVPSDPTSGEQANQTVTFDDTEGSAVGNRPPGNNVPPTQAIPDGFLLQGNCVNPSTCQTIVFVGHPGWRARLRDLGRRIHARYIATGAQHRERGAEPGVQHADANEHADEHADRHRHPDEHADRHGHPDANGNGDSDTDTDRDAHREPDGHANSDADPDGDEHGNAKRHPHGDRTVHTDAVTDCHSNADSHGNEHGNAKRHPHGDRTVHTDAVTDRHSNADLHRDTDIDGHTVVHSNRDPDGYEDPDIDEHHDADADAHEYADAHRPADLDADGQRSVPTHPGLLEDSSGCVAGHLVDSRRAVLHPGGAARAL